MRRIIATIILLLIIFFLGAFIFLKIGANGSENNFFNREWRVRFSRNSFWRKTLGLHFDGDASFDYLGTKFSKIIIKVVYMNGLYLDQKIPANLAEKIQKITGKETAIYYSTKIIPFVDDSNLSDLSNFLDEYRDKEREKNKAVIFLFITNKNAAAPQNVGSTLQEDGIILFQDALNQNYSQNENLDAYRQYAVSVLLHEFGHQMGLDHNREYDCLMNPELEIGGGIRAKEIRADFCPWEKEGIKKISKQFNE